MTANDAVEMAEQARSCSSLWRKDIIFLIEYLRGILFWFFKFLCEQQLTTGCAIAKRGGDIYAWLHLLAYSTIRGAASMSYIFSPSSLSVIVWDDGIGNIGTYPAHD